MSDLVPLPDCGRRYAKAREVRLGDADRNGRLRLDALARYLQDVANDDGRDALGEGASSWVVRRSVVEVDRWPRLGEMLTLTTFLGGVGGRWAERRTSVSGERANVECASLWVHVDLRTGRPAPLPARFHEIYGEVYGARKVSGRLLLPGPPAEPHSRVRWPTRRSDFDVLGHVNNAVYWAAVEDAFSIDPSMAGVRLELEYKSAVEPGDDVELVCDGEGGAWLVGAGTDDVFAAARLASAR